MLAVILIQFMFLNELILIRQVHQKSEIFVIILFFKINQLSASVALI